MSARSTRSKKRSAGNRSPRRPPPIFFIDQCLGRVDVAEAVRAQGYTAHLLTDRFKSNAPDETWLADVGARQWVVLTKDRHFRKRPVELQAIVTWKVRAFVLSAANLRGRQQADAIAAALPRIVRVCHRGGPIVANITAAGQVVVHDARELRKWTRLAT